MKTVVDMFISIRPCDKDLHQLDVTPRDLVKDISKSSIVKIGYPKLEFTSRNASNAPADEVPIVPIEQPSRSSSRFCSRICH